MAKTQKTQESQDFIVEEWLNSITDDGVKIRILREKDDGGWALVDSKKKSAITDEFLLKLNPGNYRLQAIRPNGTIITVRTMAIDDKPESQLVPAVPVDTDKPLIAMMQANQNQLMQVFLSVMQSNTQVLVAALSGNKGGDPAVLLNAITGAMSNMKNLGGGDELDKVDKVLSIAEKLGGNGSGPKSTVDHLLEMAKDVVPVIMAGASARALPPAPSAPAIHPPAQVPPVPPAGGSPPAGADKGAAAPAAEIQKSVSQLWAKLETGADSNYAPENAASMLIVLEDMGDAGAAVIVETMARAASFEEWQQAANIIDARRPWFGKVFAEVKQILNEGEGEKEILPAVRLATADEKSGAGLRETKI